MFGNLVNNAQLIQLVEKEKVIQLSPFRRELLQVAQYPLSVGAVLRRGSGSVSDNEWQPAVTFDHARAPSRECKIEADEYVLLNSAEHIAVPPGIVARFIPSSNLIERGFGLTAGKLEHPFGHGGERLRFGLKNLISIPNVIESGFRFAYVEFFDLRGRERVEVQITERDQKVYDRRRQRLQAYAEDSGVPYEDGEQQ